MSEKKQVWFSTGDFARLCGVTKHMLFHYDAVGVVKPARVEENGYRQYSMEQFYAMDLVATLQAAGMSLREIRDYMQARSPERFAALLEEKRADLRREQEKLARMVRVLRATEARTREGLAARVGAPRIEEWKAHPLIVTRPHGADDRAAAEACVDHWEYCTRLGIGQELPIGCMVEQEHLLSGDYGRVDYFYSPVDRARRCGRLLLRPAGLYAVVDVRGSYEALAGAYPPLMEYLSRAGYAVCGNSYEEDLVSYMATPEPEDYIIRVAVQVQKEG